MTCITIPETREGGMDAKRKAAEELLAAEHEFYEAMRDDRGDDTARSRRVQARRRLERAEVAALMAMWTAPKRVEVMRFPDRAPLRERRHSIVGSGQ